MGEDNVIQLIRCPACGSSNVRRIVYGLPRDEARAAADRGQIEWGGCMVMDGNATRCCRNCGNRFFEPARERRLRR